MWMWFQVHCLFGFTKKPLKNVQTAENLAETKTNSKQRQAVLVVGG